MPTSCLYDLAIKSDFKAVSTSLRSNPEDVEYVNGNKWTTLHVLAWKKAPLPVVKAVYKSYPAALQVRSKRGETPHDVAKDNGASKDILNFLAACEQAQICDSVLITHNLQLEMTERVKNEQMMKNKLLKLAEDFTHLQIQNKEQQEIAEQVKEENKDLTKQLKRDSEDHQKSLLALSEKCDLLQEENNHLCGLKENVNDLSDRCNLLQSENEQFMKVVVSLTSTCTSLRDENDAQNEKNMASFQNFETAHEELLSFVSDLESNNTELSTATETIGRTIVTLSNACTELKAANNKIEEDLDTSIHTFPAEVREEFLSLNEQCENLRKDDIALQSILSSLTNTCDDIVGQNDSIKEHMSNVLETVTDLISQNVEVKSRLSEVKDKGDAMEFDLNNIKPQIVNAVEVKVNDLKQKVDEVETRKNQEIVAEKRNVEKRIMFLSTLKTLVENYSKEPNTGNIDNTLITPTKILENTHDVEVSPKLEFEVA